MFMSLKVHDHSVTMRHICRGQHCIDIELILSDICLPFMSINSRMTFAKRFVIRFCIKHPNFTSFARRTDQRLQQWVNELKFSNSKSYHIPYWNSLWSSQIPNMHMFLSPNITSGSLHNCSTSRFKLGTSRVLCPLSTWPFGAWTQLLEAKSPRGRAFALHKNHHVYFIFFLYLFIYLSCATRLVPIGYLLSITRKKKQQ